MQNKLNELLAQVAWLNRQLLSHKSEKLSYLNPYQLSLFEQPAQFSEPEPLEETVVEKAKIPMTAKKQERQNRKLLEKLPVVEVIIEPQGIDLTRYKRISEEHTRTLEFETGKLYVKETVPSMG